MSEELGVKNEETVAATYLKRDSQKQRRNLKKKPKIHARLTKKIRRILSASIVLAHLEKCEEYIDGCPNSVSLNCQTDETGILYLE